LQLAVAPNGDDLRSTQSSRGILRKLIEQREEHFIVPRASFYLNGVGKATK
jgi:hypothetical protein